MIVAGKAAVTQTLTSSSSNGLDPERRLAVSDLTAMPQYANSAGLVGEVKVKAEAAY